jgi:uncharacterized membrane protein
MHRRENFINVDAEGGILSRLKEAYMKDVARVGNHPIHPMFVTFPIGLWIFSLVTDIIYRVNGNEMWANVAYYSMAGGIIGAILAALPGFVDYFALKPSRVKDIALWHMLINVSALILFCINLYYRTGAPDAAGPFYLSIIGVLGILVSSWLGGQMVYVHGLAVDETEVCKHEVGAAAHGARS